MGGGLSGDYLLYTVMSASPLSSLHHHHVYTFIILFSSPSSLFFLFQPSSCLHFSSFRFAILSHHHIKFPPSSSFSPTINIIFSHHHHHPLPPSYIIPTIIWDVINYSLLNTQCCMLTSLLFLSSLMSLFLFVEVFHFL